ncbi:MAG TPA: hypothetical protein DIW48_01685 [Sphaerochaeta sp.]|nr:MAG: hypothetical protein A2Y31_00455 [Spirochaetes bacterium GWC2_52_13]HCG62292.1 hypothetical protein [Sphaerochaeta sp.]HCS35414.1 hypothetical protein [Sphaerochaeta sp.]
MGIIGTGRSSVRGTLAIAYVFLAMTISATSFIWDSAGGNGLLGNLDLSTADSTSVDYTTGQHYSRDGFLGRFVFQGEAGTTLTVTSTGPLATSTPSGNYFYFTKTDDTNRWRRVFFVATIKAYLHSNAEGPILGTHNTIIDNPGDSITIPAGAGAEEHNTSDPSYSGGYNTQGTWGFGSAYRYKYPYKYIWIDLTTIRTTTSRRLKNGLYELGLLLSGDGISAHLNLTGRYQNYSGAPGSYSFILERTCPPTIPFQELIENTTYTNSYPVGTVRFNSVDTRARMFFASDSQGLFTDFRFASDRGSFGYHVVYTPRIPSGYATKIDSTTKIFPSTANPVPFTSPTHGETEQQYQLEGEIRIYVDPGTTLFTAPADSYDSRIYCFLTAY